MKRRELLLGMGLAAVAAPLYTRVAQASESKDASEHIVNMLFVQSAHGAELSDGKLRFKKCKPGNHFLFRSSGTYHRS